MKSDIEIARETKLELINKVACSIGIDDDELVHYGKYIAKVPIHLISESKIKRHRLILVTSISPTRLGIGKTTVSIGLALGLNKLGKRAVVALREPSLGPCFGIKGGAAGGGYAQVLPMEDINLHFTGDFHAVTSAHNMISALLDNYIYQNRNQGTALKSVVWKRVLDINDRGLRQIISGLGGSYNGVPTETGFDITPASELMAILCLASDLVDLRRRIDKILLGYRIDGSPFLVKDLGIGGSITALLKNAILPNLVQTTENTAAFIHGGPFANIAHGCNSVIATKMALTYGDYTITEAGFGADLGAEKFFNIKCRQSGLSPSLTVIVVTLQGLKLHGNIPEEQIKLSNVDGVRKGIDNLDKHIKNILAFGQTVLVALNRFSTDSDEEIDILRKYCAQKNVRFAINNAFSEGGNGALHLAKEVVEAVGSQPSLPLKFTYENEDRIRTKIEKVACKIYGAGNVKFSKKAEEKLQQIENLKLNHYPVCIAKTQYSFTNDPKQTGTVENFEFEINDIVINNGAEFVVALAGDIIRMPGLPKIPNAYKIDVINGEITGLS